MIKSFLGAVAFYKPIDQGKHKKRIIRDVVGRIVSITLKEHNPKYKEWYKSKKDSFSVVQEFIEPVDKK